MYLLVRLLADNMPCKFGDISKKAADVLNEDHQTSGYAVSNKQKTGWDGAVVTNAVDLFSGKGDVTSAGKVTFKFPKPGGLSGVSIDKFEIDKKGAMKLEATLGADFHKVKDLKLEVKTDLQGLDSLSKGLTFTGVKDTQIKFEFKPLNPSKFSAEVTRSVAEVATVGVKFSGPGVPDVGVNVAKGPVFAALTASGGFTTFNVFGSYAVNDKISAAATFQQGGKKNSGAWTAGGSYAVQKGTSIKSKVDSNMLVSASVKHEISKGVTILSGVSYDLGGARGTSHGFKVSVE